MPPALEYEKSSAKAKAAPTASFTVVVLLALALAGCVSTQDKIANQNSTDDGTCSSYGLKFGTPEYAQCRQHIADRREAQKMADQQGYNAAVLNMTSNLQKQSDQDTANFFPMPGPRPINCTTSYFNASNAFGAANTNCY